MRELTTEDITQDVKGWLQWIQITLFRPDMAAIIRSDRTLLRIHSTAEQFEAIPENYMGFFQVSMCPLQSEPEWLPVDVRATHCEKCFWHRLRHCLFLLKPAFVGSCMQVKDQCACRCTSRPMCLRNATEDLLIMCITHISCQQNWHVCLRRLCGAGHPQFLSVLGLWCQQWARINGHVCCPQTY